MKFCIEIILRLLLFVHWVLIFLIKFTYLLCNKTKHFPSEVFCENYIIILPKALLNCTTACDVNNIFLWVFSDKHTRQRVRSFTLFCFNFRKNIRTCILPLIQVPLKGFHFNSLLLMFDKTNRWPFIRCPSSTVIKIK